jgi:UDP-N-acetylmuramoyl-tripeptide--D-alanyl-D-alanine ligase
MDILTILNCLLIASAAFHLAMRYKVDLQMMQQNSYRNNRYILWWKTNSDYASISRIVDVGVLLLLFTPFPSTVTIPIASLTFIIKGITILKKKHKKPLVFTNRVWRLYITMLVFSIIFILGAILGAYPFWGMATGISLTVMSAISWLILIACNQAMKPIENAINQMYYNDAKRLLESMPDMKIIGITGSYGKQAQSITCTAFSASSSTF